MSDKQPIFLAQILGIFISLVPMSFCVLVSVLTGNILFYYIGMLIMLISFVIGAVWARDMLRARREGEVRRQKEIKAKEVLAIIAASPEYKPYVLFHS